MEIVAIDPGLQGGIACLRHDGATVAYKMPQGIVALAEFFREHITPHTGIWLEDVGYHRMGNSASSSVTFGRHVGQIEACCVYAQRRKPNYVAPKVWQGVLFPGLSGEPKAYRKQAIRESMAERYPDLKVTLAVADALAILQYAKAAMRVSITKFKPR